MITGHVGRRLWCLFIVFPLTLLALPARVDTLSARLPARVATPYTLIRDHWPSRNSAVGVGISGRLWAESQAELRDGRFEKEESFSGHSAGRTFAYHLRGPKIGGLPPLEGEVARDGPAGVAIAPATAPDIAFIDIGLPGVDSPEVGRRIRAAGGEG